MTVPAGELAREHFGRPMPNAALLAGFAALSGVISLRSVIDAIAEKLPARVVDGNVAAAEAAHAWVAGELRELAGA